MVKIQVEIEDNLEEIVDGLKKKIRENFVEYLKDNTDMTDFENYYQNQGCDFVHESSDSCTPLYSDAIIDGLFYLYGSEFDEAYENAGCGNKSENNYRQAAIYFYLHMETDKFYCELQTWFDDKILELDEEEDEEAHKSALLEAVNDLDSDLI